LTITIDPFLFGVAVGAFACFAVIVATAIITDKVKKRKKD